MVDDLTTSELTSLHHHPPPSRDNGTDPGEPYEPEMLRAGGEFETMERDMNTFHQDVWDMERSWDRGDRAWFRYCADVERLLGIKDLDGTEWIEGYSLDSANDAFRAGITPAQYSAGKRA